MTEPAYTEDDLDIAKRDARSVIEHFFGSKPRKVEHKASGLSNMVFEVEHPEGAFIVRIAPDAAKLAAFMKEQWCVGRAREEGVPVAEILEVGQGVIQSPYMIQRLERGEVAIGHDKCEQILRELGRHASVINRIETEGFGETFDWSSNKLSHNETFADFLEQEYCLDHRLGVLERHKMLSAPQVKSIRSVMKKLADGKYRGHLVHGDLRLKNVIVGKKGQVAAILDWEHCSSSIAPIAELAIALHDLSIDDKQVFLEGYGLSADEMAEVAPQLRALNVLHYAPHVERAAAAKDHAQLDAFRMRLNGSLDMYIV